MRSLAVFGLILISGCNFAEGATDTPQVTPPTVQSPKDPGSCPSPTPPPAPAPDPTFVDAQGILWKRHILTEARKDHRTLLLVIDEAVQGAYLPKIILRQSFKASEARAMQAAAEQARRPFALPHIMALTPTNNPLWPIDHAWTELDELDYNQWIAQIASSDFLVGGGVEVDCADYAIALRWIYAHDHHLPAGDNLAATGQLFGSWQSTTTWDALPTNADWKQDERFKAALRHLLNLTFTHSIFTDLYPVAITPDFVTPGTIYLTLETESGHTRTIFVAGPSAFCDPQKTCMMIIWGNEPASEQGYITDLVPYKVAADGGGFMRFRWPELTPAGWQLRPAQSMRGYSTEQYAWDEASYFQNVSDRLGLWNSPEGRYSASGNSAGQLLRQRAAVTMTGYFMCSLVPCTPKDSIYADFSTPVRDSAIARLIKVFQTEAAQVDPGSDAVFNMEINNSDRPFGGAPFNIYAILTSDLNTHFSSDPTADFSARWGVTNPTPDDKIFTGITLAYSAFLGYRSDKITAAEKLCFPNAGTTPSCDPCDPKVKALGTERIDQALRLFRTIFLADYAKASAAAQKQIAEDLRAITFDGYFCPAGGCSLYDSILGPVDHWAVMTSNADSPKNKRFGY